MGRLSQHSCKD